MTETPGHRIRDQRLDTLVRVTVDEISRVGIEGASLNRIIGAAGMSKSSFYHFVDSKAALIDLVTQSLLDDVARRWTAPAAESFAGDDFWERVDVVLAELAEVSAADAALQRLGDLFAAQPDGAVGVQQQFLASVGRWVHDVLGAGRRAGQVRDDLPLDLQAQIVFAVLRTVDQWVLAHGGHRGADVGIDETEPARLLRRLLRRDDRSAV